MALVIDASDALKWVLPEPDSQLAQALAESEEVLLMPNFWLNEATNVCWLSANGRGRGYGGVGAPPDAT